MLSRSTSRALWFVFAALIVVFGLKARGVIEARFGRVGELQIAEGGDGGQVRLIWTGQIEAPMAARLREAFARYGGGARPFVLVLNSPGGSLDQGAEVIGLLRTLTQTHKLETFVDAGAECASMCVPVYLQGSQRSAAADAQFMFHNVSYVEFVSDDAVSVPANATKIATDRFFERYLEVPGVDRDWLKGVRAAVAADGEVWKSARELVDERSGVVQAVSR